MRKNVIPLLLAICLIIVILFSAFRCKSIEERKEKVDGYTIIKTYYGIAIMGVDDENLDNGVFVVPTEIADKPVRSLGVQKPSWVGESSEYFPIEENPNITKIVINHGMDVFPNVLINLSGLSEIEINNKYAGIRFKPEEMKLNGLKITINSGNEFTDKWIYYPFELRALSLYADYGDLYGLNLKDKHQLIYYSVDGAKEIKDDFSLYSSLSAFIVPSSVIKINENAFKNSAVDVYVRVRKEDCHESLKNGWDIGANVVWGFSDEIVVFDNMEGEKLVLPDTHKNYMIVKKGDKLPFIEPPAREGFVFQGWCKGYSFGEVWDFENDAVESGMVLSAKWEKI